jgi:stage V sporulation protein AC
MDISNKEYDKMVKKASPPSRVLRNCILAFLIGGAICMLSQIINTIFETSGLEKTDASTCTSISIIFLGVLLTGLNIYDDIALYGGAGTLVPISGFANSITAPAMEYKREGYILGVGVNMFKIAGPVIVYGVVSSVVYGLIYYIFLR